MASSSIVIKVRFRETLRRLIASIKDEKLVLDIVMLKEKIRSLFNFGSDDEFTMTYVDEDGDAVTLAEDDDLHDVVRQSLNPLRITVNLHSSDFDGSSGNSTPLMSLQSQHSLQNLNSGVSEIFKSVPEPLLEALAKLPLDLASKASSSAPVVVELVEKMKDVYLNQILPSMASPRGQATTGGPTNVNSKSSTVRNSELQVNPEAGGSNSKKEEKQVQKGPEDVRLDDAQLPRGVDLNNPYFEYGSFHTPINSAKSVGEGSAGKNKDITDGVEKKKDSSSEKKVDISGGSLNGPLKHDSFVEHVNRLRQNQANHCQHLQDQFVAQRAQYAQMAADLNKNTNDSGSSSGWAQAMLNATNQCPYSGMPLTTDSDSQGYGRRSRSPHWKRRDNRDNDTGKIFHRGVICDGCGVHPITGPRFKSKVKIDYDLCDVCFAGMGNATDYIRMDHPANSFRHPLMPFKGFYEPSLCVPSPTLPHTIRTPGLKQFMSKLDSGFILDVNVLDGTIMAPFTTFTKIWRMKNTGSVVWPYGSQLQWIGGDSLSTSHSVDVEIPVHGLPVGKELDIAVDFTAPELPGRYVSYWRMSSPSGEKFGQRVWVLIQVDASMKNSGETSINLNLTPVMRDQETVNQDHLVDDIFTGNNFLTNSENTSVDKPSKDQAMDFPINDSLIINNGAVSSTMATVNAPPVTAGSSVFNPTQVGVALGTLPAGSMVASGLNSEPISYPTVDFSVMPPIMSGGSASLPMVVVQPPPLVSDDSEQARLKDLEAMGFKDRDLNKEILRMNNYNLDKSIDDLCDVLEWDPMLDELREMGFADEKTNRRLLKKNNGSIKGVVMDLINKESA